MLVENRLFIDKVLNNNNTVSNKDEILEINGKPILKYLDSLTQYRSYEIYQQALNATAKLFVKKAIHFKANKSINLKIKKVNKLLRKTDIKWISIQTNDIANAYYKPFEFKLLNDIKAGYINWLYCLDREIYKYFVKRNLQKLNKINEKKIPDRESFLHSVFDILIVKKIPYLIVDIRNNGGGNSSLGDKLIKFLTCKKIKDYDGYIKLSPLLKQKYGSIFAKLFNIYPVGNRVNFKEAEKILKLDSELKLRKRPKEIFKGKIIVLTSYSTYSAGETFAGQIKKYLNPTLMPFKQQKII